VAAEAGAEPITTTVATAVTVRNEPAATLIEVTMYCGRAAMCVLLLKIGVDTASRFSPTRMKEQWTEPASQLGKPRVRMRFSRLVPEHIRPDPGGTMASDSSFDIVSKVDKQEVANALNQAQKEIAQRYDFKGVGAEVDFSGEKILMKANSEERVKAVLDVLQSKLVKRGISLKSLDAGEPFASGKEYRIEAGVKEGIAQDQAKKISKIIRDEGPKGVKAQIQGDELRVTSKSRDDLQEVISLLKGSDLDVDLQFINYR
jgi:uncharacterized protein YajQ (UPF0234 family)